MIPKETMQTSDNLQYSDLLPWHEQGDDTFDYWDKENIDHQLQNKSNDSHSTSLRHSSSPDTQKRLQFLRDMENARNQLVLFRQEMNGLALQMNGISEDLHESKNRVCEIEQDLTETQEDNVNLQVLLERAVRHQKESDVFATQTIRNIHSDLNLVVIKNNQLHERLSSIEYMQKEHKGNVHETVARLREYVTMLEQAQDTIQLMQEPIKHHIHDMDSNSVSMQDLGLDSRRTSETLSTEGDDIGILGRKASKDHQQQTTKRSSFTTYPRIVHKRASFPAFLPSPLLPPQKDMGFSPPYRHYEKHHHHHTSIRKPGALQPPKRYHPSNSRASKSQQGLLLLLND